MPIRPVQLILALLLMTANVSVLAESVNKKDDITVTLTDLIDKLRGTGVTITSPAYVAEDNAQAGIFSGYGFLFGDDVDEGVVFSTGDVDSVVGTNSADNTTTAFNTTLNNDPLFGAVRDLVTLTFDVVPDENTLIVEYVFGSEEYNEFVNGGFNDFIRIFVNGTNCAVTANGLIVSIDAVNNGSNNFLYKDNDFGDFTPNFPFNTEMDGFTRTVSCRFPVTPGVSVPVVIGMADDGDANFDSWAFFKAQSLRSEPSDEFGDAPNTYQTLALSNGAAHTIIEGVYMGTTPSGDQNGFVDGVDDSAGNAADDSSDDGVFTFSTLDADLSTSYSITVNATSINAKGARFIGWIDFDGDGQFQVDEASNLTTLATDQFETDVTLNWPTITGAGPDIVMGATFARIRMVNDDEIISSGDFAGIFLSGEVEDYKFQITGAGDVTASVVTIDALLTATSSIIAAYPVTGTCTAGDGNVDVVVASATPTNQSVVCNGGGFWTALFDVTAIADGVGVISVTATQTDSRGNSGSAGPSLADKDVTPPTIDIQNEPVNVNSTAAFNVTFQFDEDVTGFSSGEITVTNASVSNFVSVDATTYTADITPDGAGNITIDVAANVAQDSVNNNNTAATQAVVVFDNVNPVVIITSAPVANAGNVAAYPVSGTCTAGDGNITVAISGASPANQSVVCTAGGTWSATFDVLAIADSTNALSVDASQTDAASNTGNAVTVQADKESNVPTVDIQGEPVINNLTPYNVTIEFSEDVTGFVSGDVTVGNGSVTGFTVVDGSTYTVQITPVGTGNITIDVAANVAQDGAANNNTAATQAITVLDIVVPTVDIQGEPAIVNSTAAFNVTIEFSENVIGFVVGDVTVANGSVTGFTAVDGSTYTVQITPDSVGDILIDVASNVAVDVANNNNTAAAQAVTTFDNTAPTVDIQGEPVIVNSTLPFNVTVEFSEDVTGFASGDVTVGNGSVTNFTPVNGSAYTVEITPNGAGNITIDVAANVAIDAASNNNTSATQATTTFDNTAPTVDIQGEPISVNSTAPFNVTVEFSEDVTGFVSGDVSVGNGSVTNFTPVDGSTYTVEITPDGLGDVTVDVAANVAIDVAANNNTAAPQASITFDNTAPTVNIQGEPATVNSISPFNVTVEFSEDVTGFVSSDVVVGNGSVINFTPVDGTTYTVEITPDGGGDITIDVAENVATDAAGNDNTAATQATSTFDNTVPTVDIQGEPAIINSTTPFNVTVEFSEDVTGFVSGDVSVGNGSVTNFTPVDGSTYTIEITPDGLGDVTVDVAANVAIDAASNDNTAAPQAVTTFDNTAPAVDIQGEPTSINSTTPFNVTVEFSENVTGFVSGDVVVGNGSVTNFTPVDGTTYTVEITPSGSGDVTVDVAANVAVDGASNNNTAAPQAITAFDNTAPTVDIQGEPAIINSTTPFNVTVEFSEDVTGFVSGDVSVGNGSVTNFTPVDGSTYTVEITPDGLGDVTVDVVANVAIDVAANNNTAAPQASITFDNTAPTVDIQGEPAIVNSTTPFNVTVQFSESVTGFTSGEVTVGNGSVTNFTPVDGNTYTVEITPNGGGDVTVDVAANVAVDAASNNNTAAPQAMTTFDNTAPTVDIQGEPVNVNSTTAFNVSVIFSEDVTGFVSGDVLIGNGSVTNFTTVNGNTYTVEITPDGNGNVSIDVAANVSIDVAGNNNTAAAQALITFDNTKPTVDIQGEPATINLTPFNVTVQFSESVTGFTSGEVTVGNGSVTNFTAVDGDTYTVEITPDGGGDITINVAADVAQDAASNTNTAAIQATTVLDNALPSVDIQGEPAQVNSLAAFNVTFAFSENVTGFVLGDINVGNGAASNFIAVDGSTYTADITPTGAGDISIDVAANVAQDAVTNGNTAAVQAVTSFDNAPPVVVITSAPDINASNELSYPVSGTCTVGDGDVSVSITEGPMMSLDSTVSCTAGGTWSANFNVSGLNDGATIDINAGQTDAASNQGTAVTIQVEKDVVVPTVDIQGEPTILNSVTPFNVTAEFSEDVTGFDASDVTVTNGSATNVTPVNGNTYTVEITPNGVGAISIDIAANRAQDATGNGNTSAVQANIAFDATAPSVDIQGEPAIVNSAAPFNVTVEFSEDITGFVSGEVTVGNGSVTNFTSVDASTYTVEITPDGNGDITVDVAANVAIDAASNNNTAAIQAISTFDNTAPTVDIQGEPVSVNSIATYNVTIVFSEDVTGFVIGDIAVGNGAASNFVTVNANTYTADITPGGAGDITIDVAANVAIDGASNNNTAAIQAVSIFDNTAPTVDIQNEPATSNASAFNVTFKFNEDVTGFVIGDIAVANALASNFITVDANTYTADITPDGAGDVTIDVAGNVAQDLAGNNNTAAIQAVVAFVNDSDNDGILDSAECPGVLPPFTNNNCPDSDGDGLADFLDTDSDNDGIPDSAEAGPNPNNPIDTDGDGTPDYLDEDSDGDGISDLIEGVTDTDGDGIPDYVDTGDDFDGDGIPDSVECPTYPNCPDTDNDGQLDYIDLDSDGDTIPDANEAGVDPTQPLDTDGDGTPDYQDTDSDNDGTDDSVEVGGDPLNPVDTDGDGIPDYVDAAGTAGPPQSAGDSDGDGIPDNIECALYPLCADSDGDGTPDYMETDSDNDGIPDSVEAAITGLDDDGDGIDNALDVDSTDVDGNGIFDDQPTSTGGDGIDDRFPLDSDGDGTPNYQDTDSDNDGVDDAIEGTVDTDSDLIPDYLDIDFAGPGPGDSDGDGINDDVECPAFPACPDSDGDGKPDYLDDNDTDGPLGDTDNDGRLNFIDPDDDNDGIPDSVEDFNTDGDNNPFTNPNDTDGDGVPDYRDTDSDDDGINDTVDSGLIEPLVDTDGDGLFDPYDVDITGGSDTNLDGVDDAVQPKDDDNDGIFDQLDADVATDGSSGDSDGDGIPDDVECTAFPDCEDTDGDGVPDYLDDDADNDGIPDAVEIGQLDSGIIADSDGDGIPDFKDTDSDNDGILDANEGVVDSDGDGIPDYVDPESSGLPNGGDSDGDGVEDRGECSNYPACADSDNDGVPDYLDADSRPYDPNDEINTGLKGVGSNNAAYLLLLLFMIITLRHSFFRRGLFLLALSFSAQSEEVSQFKSNWYIGFGLGVTELSPDTNNTGFSVSDDKDTGWKLFGGYDYNEALSFEGFYSDLGAASLSNQGNVLLNPNGEIDYSILGGSVLWYFWHDKEGEEYTTRRGWQTFINGGLSMLDNSANVNFSQNNSVQIHFGAGVEYGWDNGFMVRAGLDTFDKDATLISVSLIKRFGKKSKSKKLKRKEPAERTYAVPEKIIPAAPIIVSYDVDGDADSVIDKNDQCPDTRANVVVNAEGCSIFQVALEGINFENNSAEIKSESTAILNKTAQALISEPGIRVEVQAHTDSVGSKNYNQKLSEKRATSVREYLISQGVTAAQLESKGYGESSPVLSNDTEDGRARNRRVELKVIEEKSETN
ncbi:internalin, putative [hydrothermal vent metagenome]|uniref:Internalin, putative n=1 Tax=hydrothermal vent metagenome TaxID=652676 RepID=A0A3B0WP22_9ZZZZ